MTISISQLTDKDIGKWVTYTPLAGKSERGRIKSWGTNVIFVVYKCDNEWDRFQDYTGCATKPQDLSLDLHP